MAMDRAESAEIASSRSCRKLVSDSPQLNDPVGDILDIFSEWQGLFYAVHSLCLWDEKGPKKIRDGLEDLIVAFIKQAQSRVLIAGEEQALLKAYIIEWRKFFTQSSYLPLPFWQLETSLQVS
jgi:Cullin family